MRIAMVTDSYHPTKDGVVTSITITQRALEALGHEVFIVAPDPGEGHRIDGVIYIKSIRFKSYEGYFIPIFPSRARSRLKELDVDIIHIHGVAVMALKGYLMSRRLRIPTVMTFHTMVGDVLQYYSPIKSHLDTIEKAAWIYLKWIIGKMDALITPTPGIGRELCERVVPKRLEIIPTGTDAEHFHPGIDGAAFRKELGLTGKVVCCVGRLSFEKNIEVAIRAMRDVDATLLIVGEGPSRSFLEDVVKEEGLDGKVIFTGFIPNAEVSKVYAASDALVSASEFETQGLSVLEAMATGIPVACRDARAFHDIIRDGENGYLFKNPEGCADAVNRALNASDDVREASLRTAHENSEDVVVGKLVKLYEELITGKEG